MTQIETKEKEIVEFVQETQGMNGQLSIARIKNNEGYEMAADVLQRIKGRLKQLEDFRKSITAPLDTAKKRVMDLFRPAETFLAERERQIKNVMLNYQQEQETIRREEERKAQEEARKREEAERKKLEEKAAKAAAKGDEDKAEELRQQAQEVYVPTPTVTSKVPEVKGIGTRKVWKARITDFSKIPVEHLTVTDKQREAHESYFGKVALSMKNTIKVPGVEFFEATELASASR